MMASAQTPEIIVVGVDDTAASRAALDFALGEGVVRGVEVEVVTAWTWDSSFDGVGNATTGDDADAIAYSLQEQVVQNALDRLDERPVVSRTVVHEDAGPALVARSDHAVMLVVGSERQGPFARFALGSVSEHCVRNAVCPVVVVPDPARVAWKRPRHIKNAASTLW